MFAFDMTNSAQKITDGLSNTFMMGEGAQGPNWQVMKQRSRGSNLGGGRTGQPQQGWVPGEPNNNLYQALVSTFAVGGTLSVTNVPLNQNPVMQELANTGALTATQGYAGYSPWACNSSVSANPIGHHMAGFRSSHSGGANFLMADGSARFVPTTIDSANYYAGSPPIGNPGADNTSMQLTSGQYPNWTQNTTPGALGAYQALSTRAGGEPVSPP
jgi:prepilin-type processing-associated H-X9-DG protein